jgi:DNA-binding SARP family transcriptional activator
MCSITVRLFGTLQVQRDSQEIDGSKTRKTQELFAYLLLHRDRKHSRQVLADMLWPESTTKQSMKYLRHTLWQLQTTLGCDVLEGEAEYVRLQVGFPLWLDVLEFERAWAYVKRIPGEALDKQGEDLVQDALKIYRGDLLEGWYQDWCLFERDRLQRMYLAMLEKWMAHCEVHGEFEAGLECGTHALRYDVAHERIHRRMMRLYYKSGDRSAALRQYERCVVLLREELDVDPSERTVALYQHMRSNRLAGLGHTLAAVNDYELATAGTPLALDQALTHLKQLTGRVSEVEHQLLEAIQTIETALRSQP